MMKKESISQDRTRESGSLYPKSRTKIAELKTSSSPDKMLDDPAANGLKSIDDLQGLRPYRVEVKSGMNFTGLLKDYFKNIAGVVERSLIDKEVALSLYYLAQQRDVSGAYINVNNICATWQIEIKDGQLFVTTKNGEKIIDGAYLRKPKNTSDRLGQLKKDVEKLRELPKFIYKYERSKYVPIDAGNIDIAGAVISSRQMESDPGKPFKIIIRSTADNVHFRLDSHSKKRRVDLNRGRNWQNDYIRALTSLKNSGALSQLSGLDFGGKGIFAVHDLNLSDQQVVMNHALAYLRGEKLRDDLKGKIDGENVEFEIKTDWLNDPNTRIASVIDLVYSEKPKPPAPKPPKPIEPVPTPKPPEPKPPKPIEPAPRPSPKKTPPTKPDEIPGLIETLENERFKISKRAILKGGLLRKTQEMTASTVTKKDGRIIDTWFVIDKKNPENPKYYIAIDRSNKFRVLIGEMEYDSGILSIEAKPGKILQAIELDKTNRQATIKSLARILEIIK